MIYLLILALVAAYFLTPALFRVLLILALLALFVTTALPFLTMVILTRFL